MNYYSWNVPAIIECIPDIKEMIIINDELFAKFLAQFLSPVCSGEPSACYFNVCVRAVIVCVCGGEL